MRGSQVAAIVAWVVAMLVAGVAGAGEPMPEIILGPENQGVPTRYWVSAEAAVTSDGELNWSLMDSADQAFLREYVAKVDAWSARRAETREQAVSPDVDSAGPTVDIQCPSYFGNPYGGTLPRDLESAVTESIAIITGRVVARSNGFSFLWVPGVLLKVRTQSVLKTAEGMFAGPDFFVFYPKASFMAGRVAFCSVDDELPAAPQVGDTLLILPPFPADDVDRAFVIAHRQRFFVQSTDGRLVRAPIREQSIVPEGVTDLDGLADAVRRLVGVTGSAAATPGTT